MAFEEKRAWIMVVTAVGGYGVYLTIVLGRLQATPVSEVPYVATLLWCIGAAIVASIVLHIVVAIVSGQATEKKDERDREIYRFGEYIGQSFLVIGGVSALALAMFEVDYFWIANAIYLAFVLSSILGSLAKIAAYRRGSPSW